MNIEICCMHTLIKFMMLIIWLRRMAGTNLIRNRDCTFNWLFFQEVTFIIYILYMFFVLIDCSETTEILFLRDL